MPFSTSFCLTNPGSLPSNTTLSFYSNVDGYTNPFQSSVPLLSVTGNNCPFTLTGVYDGTTTIKVQSSTGNCCAVINVSPNNPCSFCNIGFDYFLPNTISQIVAGNLTGSCDSVISDYRIEWYETSTGSPIFVFTTGPLNTLFGSVQHTHPLVGGSAVPVPNGIYKPVLTRVEINGIKYSSTSGAGLVQADLNNCFSTITVTSAPLTCANGPETGNYSHVINFSGASQGIVPSPVTVVYQLGPNTKYLAWSFNGYSIPDTLKITYYGSYYNNNPIVLEYVSIGSNIIENDFTLTLNPKLFKRGYAVKKVTNITNIVRSPNDYLLITVTPNADNLSTNFNSGFQCLDTFDCATCWDQFNTSPPKIIAQTILATDLGCNTLQLSFKVSGCSYNDVKDSDYYKYGGGFMPYTYGGVDNNGNTFSEDDRQYPYLYPLKNTNTSCFSISSPSQASCPIPTGNGTIIFVKNQSGVGGSGNILIKCSSIQDFNAYYNSYLSRMNQINQTYSSNPTNIGYYQYFKLSQPKLSTNAGTALNQACGDGQSIQEYSIHPSSVVTTGFTNGYYTMNLTMPTITKQIFFTNCQVGCDSEINFVLLFVNSSSISNPSFGGDNQMNTTNQRSNRFDNPFNFIQRVKLTTDSYTAHTFTSEFRTYKYITDSIFYSGSPLTVIPSLSATTCTFSPNTQFCPTYNPTKLSGYYIRYIGWYQIRLPNPLNYLDYEIVTTQITNGGWPGISWDVFCDFPSIPSNLIVIYKVVNGQVTISNPNYIIQSAPPSVYTVYKRYDNI
jgi:hypothetical protein